MNNKIESPKVFISYAWGSEEYQAKVLALASDLMGDGINVVFDRWSLKEGNDTYTFMEQSVTDTEITNVLILLDPNYEKKANARDGGVGTETQIISPEVYNKVKQEKFLPVIFERGENGEIPKPQYLKGMLHFDLSQEETYDLEYQRLVRRLYGIEVVKKPDLGNAPSWLEEISTVSNKVRTAFGVLKNQQTDSVKCDKFRKFLNEIKEKTVTFKKEGLGNSLSAEEYIALYDDTKKIRDEFLQLMKYTAYISESCKMVADILEEICVEIQDKAGFEGEVVKTLLHEIFIYVIAIYLKNKDYQSLSYILTKTYFVGGYAYDEAQSFHAFYDNNKNLDNSISKRDNKQYLSGTAAYWINNIEAETCNKNEFVFADLICFNASIFIDNNVDGWYWFPITYIYGGNGNGNLLRRFSIHLKSREHLHEAALIFGYSSTEAFVKKFVEVEEKLKNGNFREYRYHGSFENASTICQFIKSEELGIRN